MARIRSVHPGLWTDETFVSLSMAARLLLIGVGGEADDGGVFEWRPLTLKMRLFPVDNIDVVELLAELATAGMVRRFEVEARPYGAIRNFCRWQRPKSPQILHPCPADVATFVARPAPGSDNETVAQRGTALGRLLCERQSGKCHYCTGGITFYRKKANSLEIDHATPLSRGGDDCIENLVAACRECSSGKGSMTEGEFRDCEIFRRRVSEVRKAVSETGVDLSQAALPLRGEINPQMEDGGGRGKKETASQSPPKKLDEMVAVRNEVCGDVLPKAKGIAPASRATALRNRMANEMSGSVAAWRSFCQRVRTAPHLIGDNNRGWKAGLDWCLNPTNMGKVLEGNYDRTASATARTPGQSYAGGL